MKNPLDTEVPEHHQFIDIFREIRKAIDDLESGVEVKLDDGSKVRTPSLEQFLSLAAAAIRDGYPTQSMRGSSSRSTVLDEDKRAIPPISDPTGELVAAKTKIADPIYGHARSVLRGLTDALGDLRMSRAALITGSQYAEAQDGSARCSSCARIGEWSDAYRGDRCTWCHKFWLMWRREPPIDILKAHHEGRRITPQMVKDAFAPPKSKTRHG